MALIAAFSLLALVYLGLFAFKNYFPRQAEHLYHTWGFDIGLFQWKLTFSAKGRWITNIATTRRFKKFYKYGTFISCLLIVPGLFLGPWALEFPIGAIAEGHPGAPPKSQGTL